MLLVAQLNTNIATQNTYSEKETFTGKYWIDGKKIYRKVIYFGNVTSSTSGATEKTISFPKSNFDIITSITGLQIASNGAYVSIPCYAIDGSFREVFYNSTFEVVWLRLTNESASGNYYVFVEYTKHD